MRALGLGLFAAVVVARAAAGADVAVQEAVQKFDPDLVRLHQGDAMVVKNADTGTHSLSMTDDEGEATDLGVQAPGGILRIRFESLGRYRIRCSITPAMKMTVIVEGP